MAQQVLDDIRGHPRLEPIRRHGVTEHVGCGPEPGSVPSPAQDLSQVGVPHRCPRVRTEQIDHYRITGIPLTQDLEALSPIVTKGFRDNGSHRDHPRTRLAPRLIQRRRRRRRRRDMNMRARDPATQGHGVRQEVQVLRPHPEQLPDPEPRVAHELDREAIARRSASTKQVLLLLPGQCRRRQFGTSALQDATANGPELTALTDVERCRHIPKEPTLAERRCHRG